LNRPESIFELLPAASTRLPGKRAARRSVRAIDRRIKESLLPKGKEREFL
jgi:hypothetical protein